MSGDYSRFTFDPKKNYSSVLKQQGRVSLDADANEAAAIQDRRWRAETMDIFGHRCVVPDGADGANSNAFLVTPYYDDDFARWDLRIDIGRMYVDGLLVENHGAEDVQFQLSLEELRGSEPLTFYNQPYYRQPPDADDIPPPDPNDPKPYLVYLCAWQREVTALQEPALRETALGGPDTATRLQTIWQVRVWAGVDAENCDDDSMRLGETWSSLSAPSAGRLTVTATPPSASQLPCELSPEGGYRGLENRLYRVEIHRVDYGDETGEEAYFKWSRDNASVSTTVEAIDDVPDFPNRRKLRLGSLGRDPYLRFETGNWVELLDDVLELGPHSGLMAQIVALASEAEQTVVVEFSDSEAHILSSYEGSFGFDPTDLAARHTRLRRWDQSEGVGPDGLIDVRSDHIDLEDGIRIQFSLDASIEPSRFKVGDYWVFAARTATGEVDELVNAPPKGVHSHYCRLALFHWTEQQFTREDCRNHWPPEVQTGVGQGCCTIVVEPEAGPSSIQDAIDFVSDAGGGCVCLRAGLHTIETTINVTGSNIVLQGESPAAVIQGESLPLLSATGAQNLRIRGLSFELSSTGEYMPPLDSEGYSPGLDSMLIVDWALISFSDCEAIELGDSILRESTPEPSASGVLVQNSNYVSIAGNQFESLDCGIMAFQSRSIVVTDNMITWTGEQYPGWVGMCAAYTEDISIRQNRIEDYDTGVWTVGQHAFLVQNNIIRSSTYIGIQAEGVNPYDVTSPRFRAESQFVIEGNTVEGPLDGSVQNSTGIQVTDLDGVSVVNNHVQHYYDGIFLSGTVANSVKNNRVAGSEFAGIFLSDGSTNCVAENYLIDSVGCAIHALKERGLHVYDNTIENMAAGGLIAFGLQEAVTLSRNRILWCGSEYNIDIARAASIHMEPDNDEEHPPHAIVESCYVFNTGVSPDGTGNPGNQAVDVWIEGAASCRIQSNELLATSPLRQFLNNDIALRLRATPTVSGSGSAMVLDNRITGIGNDRLVEFFFGRPDGASEEFTGFRKVLFSNNVCIHTEAVSESATVKVSCERSFTGRVRLIMMGNSITTELRNTVPEEEPWAFDLPLSLDNVILIGNVFESEIGRVGSTIPVDNANLNLLLT